MKPFTSQLLLSAAALLPSIYAQAPQIVGTGIDPVCEDVSDVTIIEYPAYFSTVYESVGTIFNFLGGTNSLVINNPPQTIITSTVLTTTVTSTTTATVTATSGVSATLGAGLPAGTVVNIPSNSPIVIAYIVDAVGGRRPKGFAGPDGTTDNPDDADPFYLQNGELRTLAGAKFGRNESDTYAAMVATTYDNEVTWDFFFVDGELRWNSPDRGEATFYECGDNLYAGFPDAPFSNCTEATVGGISEEALDAEASTTSISTTRQSTSGGSSGSTRSGTSSASLTSGSSMSGSSSSRSSTNGSTSSGSSTSVSGSSTVSVSSTTRSSTSISSSSSTGSGTTSSGSGTTTSSGASTTTSAAGNTAVCMDDDDEVVDGYEILCARGLVADDLGVAVEATSFGKCIDRCTNTPLCVSLSFNRNSKFCYLHSSLHLDFSNVGTDFDSAELVNAGESSTTTSSSGASTTSTSGAQTTSTASSTGTSSRDDGATTTSTAAGTTTTSPGGGSTEDCPVEELGGDYFGYTTFCGYAVDPTDDNNKLNGAGDQAESFDDCTVLCDITTDCSGVSYFAGSTTCYIFKGAHKAPVPLAGWIGAFKEGSEGPDGPTAGTTTTSAGGAATTTSDSGAATTTSLAGDDATTTTTSGGEGTTTTSSNSGESTTTTTSAAGTTTTTSGVGGGTTTTTSAAGTTTTASDVGGGTTSTTSAAGTTTTTSGVGAGTTTTTVTTTTTTTTSAAATTTTAASGPLCPGTAPGTEVNGFEIYCGYTADAATDAGGNALPASAPGVIQDLEGCIAFCTGTCTGVTFNSGPKICYPHKGESNPIASSSEFSGAVKVDAGNAGDPTNPAPAANAPPDCDSLNTGTCPASGSVVLSADNNYYLYGSYGLTGQNIITGPGAIAPADDFAACQARCTSVAECTSFSFQTIVPFTCYLHQACYIGTNNDVNFSSGVKVPEICQD